MAVRSPPADDASDSRPQWDDSPAGAPPRGYSLPSSIPTTPSPPSAQTSTTQHTESQRIQRLASARRRSPTSRSESPKTSSRHSNIPSYSPSKADIRRQYDARLRASMPSRIRPSQPQETRGTRSRLRLTTRPSLANGAHSRLHGIQTSYSARRPGPLSPEQPLPFDGTIASQPSSPTQCRRANVPPLLEAVSTWDEDEARSISASHRTSPPSRRARPSRSPASRKPARAMSPPQRPSVRRSPTRHSPPRTITRRQRKEVSYAERFGRQQFPELYAKEVAVEVCSLSGTGSGSGSGGRASTQGQTSIGGTRPPSSSSMALESTALEIPGPAQTGESSGIGSGAVGQDPEVQRRTKGAKGAVPVVQRTELDLCTTLDRPELNRACHSFRRYGVLICVNDARVVGSLG